MRFFFCSQTGDSVFLALRIEQEGNDVLFFESEPNPKSPTQNGQGLLRTMLRGDDRHWSARDLARFIGTKVGRDAVILFDSTSSAKTPTGSTADLLRSDGYAVWGTSRLADALEHNRAFGSKIMAAAGIAIPRTVSLSGEEAWSKAAEAARADETLLVFKPHGEGGTAKTIVADDTAMLLHELELFQHHWKGELAFELQERVPGIEVSLEGWFDGHDWIRGSLFCTIEEKKFLTGGLGQNHGCSGNVVWFWRHEAPELFKATLRKVTPMLRRSNFMGPLDINTKGGLGLEWTPRFGYDAYNSMIRLLQGDVSRVFADAARGQLRRLPVRYDFAGSVRVSIPPYPHTLPTLHETAGQSITLLEDVAPWFDPVDVAAVDRELVTAGNSGFLGTVNAVSPSTLPEGLDKLEQLTYARVQQVRVQDMQYRTDIFSFRAKEEIPVVIKSLGNPEVLRNHRGKRSAGQPK